MLTAELLTATNTPLNFEGFRSIVFKIRLGVRFILGLIEKKNDSKMLAGFEKAQGKAIDQEILHRAKKSQGVEDDIGALNIYLSPLYRVMVPKRYDALVSQAISEEVSWFLYPLFLEAMERYIGKPDQLIEVFQNSAGTLNLLGKNTIFNQLKEEDSQLFFVGDKIEASEELKRIAIGKARGCPLMRIKSAVTGTLMTDFMITCVKFWLYRKLLQKKT